MSTVFGFFSRRRPVDLWDAFLFYLTLVVEQARFTLQSLITSYFVLVFGLLWFQGGRQLLEPSSGLSSIVGFGHERIVSLGYCALALLCILDLLSSLSALGHGKRWRIHGIDLTGGIYNGSDSVGGVLGEFLLRVGIGSRGLFAIRQAL